MLEYTNNPEKIEMAIFLIKYLFINIGSYYIFLKLSNQKNDIKMNLIATLEISVITYFYALIRVRNTQFDAMSLLIIFMIIIFTNNSKKTIGTTIIMTIISIGISFSIFFIAAFLNSIPNIILHSCNKLITVIGIGVTYLTIFLIFLRNKRLKNGIISSGDSKNNEQMDMITLNISATMLFLIGIFKSSKGVMTWKMGSNIIILSIIMFLTIKKSFQVYYKQKLMIKQLEETEEEVKEKDEEIKKLEQENLSFSKRSHSLAHKQKALEYKLNQLLMNEETANELGIQKEVKDLSKELYQKPVEELTKTGIRQIDDMLEFMQAECTKNNIDFNFQIMGNVYYIINNIISVEKLEILLADHIKDAIIAIKHTDNINRSILVRLGKIEECYGLYIYDSGIEFEKETLQNLGKKPSTTHEDEGGTGMGFMNTFDTLRKCRGSLIINEISKPSKDNFTKVIMIKFDNKNEFNVISYKN